MGGEPAATAGKTKRGDPASAAPGARRRRTIRRAALALLAPALIVLVLFVLCLRWRAAELQGFLGLGGPAGEIFLGPLRDRIAQVDAARLAGRPAPPAILLVGDSVVMGMPDRLAPRLAERGGLEVVPVATFLLRPIHFAYLEDEMLRAEPSLAIVELNLVWLNPPDGVYATSWYRRLSRFLSAARMPRIAAALRREQASLLDPWIFDLEERLGILYAGEGLRAAARTGLARAARTTRTGLDLSIERSLPARHGVAWVAQAYANDFAAAPNLAVLREIRRGFAEAGVPVLFLVPPVNLAELDRLGLPAPPHLDERIEALRAAIGATPDEWLDLHRLDEPGDFRDVLGHLSERGADKVAAQVAATARRRLDAATAR